MRKIPKPEACDVFGVCAGASVRSAFSSGKDVYTCDCDSLKQLMPDATVHAIKR